MTDRIRSVQLYEKAWKNKVPIAAFELGRFYEGDISRLSSSGQGTITSDLSKAWSWYQMGADVGEPRMIRQTEMRSYFTRSVITRLLPSVHTMRLGRTMRGGTGAIVAQPSHDC
jgi:hypothetical protein